MSLLEIRIGVQLPPGVRKKKRKKKKRKSLLDAYIEAYNKKQMSLDTRMSSRLPIPTP